MTDARPWAAVCRFGGIGDNLIASSILPLLARQFRVEVITRQPQGVVFENNPFIDKLTFKDEADMPRDSIGWQGWFRARAKEYSLLLNLSHSCETTLALVAGQSQFYWPEAWRRKACGGNYLEAVHDIAGLPHEFGPAFFPTHQEQAKASATKARVGKRCVGWLLGGSRLDKIYPKAGLAVARIISELDVPVILFGAPGRDHLAARLIEQLVEAHNGSIAGLHGAISPDENDPSWPIRRSLATLKECDVVVGPDTGAMWAVAMDAMPKIVLLSHASPRNITEHWRNARAMHADPSRVPCWPCHRLHDDASTCTPNAENTGAACISDIPIGVLLAAIRGDLYPCREAQA